MCANEGCYEAYTRMCNVLLATPGPFRLHLLAHLFYGLDTLVVFAGNWRVGNRSRYICANVAELVDALDLGSSAARRESSSLFPRTTIYHKGFKDFEKP